MAEREKTGSIIKGFTTSDSDQRLVKLLNRGGLTAVRDEIFEVFLLAEEEFRVQTAKEMKSVDVACITENVLTNARVISLINSTIEVQVEEDAISKIGHQAYTFV